MTIGTGSATLTSPSGMRRWRSICGSTRRADRGEGLLASGPCSFFPARLPWTPGMTPDREELKREIAREEVRLAELEGQRAQARKQLEILRSRLAESPLPPSPKPLSIIPPVAATTMPIEKVRLF